MKMCLSLFWAEGKRMLVCIPGMLGKTGVLLLLLVLLLLGAGAGTPSGGRIEPFTVGISKEDDIYGEMLMLYLTHMKSMEGVVNIVRVTQDEGRQMLREGQIEALVSCPAGFLEGIISGTNEPVSIYLSQDSQLAALMFRSLAQAGEKMLAVSQAEIYGAYQLAETYGQQPLLPVLQTEININQLNMILGREELFDKKEIGATGNASPAEYYAASILVLLLLLMGSQCHGFLKPQASSLKIQLRRAGISPWQSVLIKITWVGIFLIVFFFLLLSGLSWLSAGVLSVVWDWKLAAGTAAVVWCIASITVLCFQIVPHGPLAMLLLLGLSVMLLFISGGLIPAVFLPEAVNAVAGVLPGVWLIRVVLGLLLWESTWTEILVVCVFTLTAYGLAVGGEYMQMPGKLGRDG